MDGYIFDVINNLKNRTMKTRFGKLRNLINEYNNIINEYPKTWPDKFRPQWYLTESNHGGKLIILSNDGGSIIYWDDWADTAVSDHLSIREVCNWYQGDNDELEIGDPYFMDGDIIYPLSDFMRTKY